MPNYDRSIRAANGFNYEGAFGSNPWTTPTRQISSLVSSLMGSLSGFSGLQSSGGSSSSTSSLAARPDDLEVQSYMSHVLGGQRTQLDEYVRRAAGAGIKRGGMNVVGGPSLDSSLHHSAMKTLAGGYADRFREAMSYNRGLRSELYSRYNDSLSSLQSLLGTQHRFLSSQADWSQRMGSLRHSDYLRELDWQRDTPFRELRLEGLKRDAEMQKWRNQVERENRNWEVGRHATLQQLFNDATANPANSALFRYFTAPEQVGIRSQLLGYTPFGSRSRS
ncbi:MAG: hypothetical protein LDL33_11825 [Desulfomonile sp.]|nr:hypothetical protein [Desulfomonile sp.]